MAFSDVEMIILCKAAYKNPSKGQTLGDFLKNSREYLINELGSEYETYLVSMISKTSGSGYTVIKAEADDNGTGFAAFAVTDPDNNVTIAARGTEGFHIFTSDQSRRDVAADAALGFHTDTNQQEKMLEFMYDLESDGNYSGYYLTGHSLGGNLANYGAIAFKPQSKIKGAVVYNAPGFNEAFLAKYADEIKNVNDRIKNYQNENDIVSSIQYSVGNVTILKSKKGNQPLLDFNEHGLDAIKIPPEKGTVKSLSPHLVFVLVEDLKLKLGVKRNLAVIGFMELLINFGMKAYTYLSKLMAQFGSSIRNRTSGSGAGAVRINPVLLHNYAGRIDAVNSRLKKLDKRLDSLYLQVKVTDLWTLLQADYLTEYSRRLNKCARYLDDTAYDFEKAEKNILNRIRG